MRKEFRLFLPEELHAEIKDKAWENKISMNRFILDCVERGVGLAMIEQEVLEQAFVALNHKLETPTDVRAELPDGYQHTEEKPEIDIINRDADSLISEFSEKCEKEYNAKNLETPTEECTACVVEKEEDIMLSSHTCSEEKPEMIMTQKEYEDTMYDQTKIAIEEADKALAKLSKTAGLKKCKSCKTKTSNFVIRNGKEVYVCDKHIKNV